MIAAIVLILGGLEAIALMGGLYWAVKASSKREKELRELPQLQAAFVQKVPSKWIFSGGN